MLIWTPFRADPSPSPNANGDDRPWGRWVPTMWHALADPLGVHLWPEPPLPTSGVEDMKAMGWWLPAVHLCAYSLAWPRLDVGMRWWHDAGKPTDDPRLALLDQMLRDRVDELAGWMWCSNHARQLEDVIAERTNTAVLERYGVRVENAWLRDLERRVADTWSPYGAASDPMHLGVHGEVPVWGSDGASTDGPMVLRSDRRTGRAVLLLEQYKGWYAALAAEGARLPELAGGRSWRIEIVCRPVGHLGTYRRSRLTGRWFAGRHRYHQRGWPESDP